MIEFGCTYKDKITGFIGICTGYVQYITGCNQALLAPKIDSSGKRVDAEWFDEQRLIVQKVKKISLDNTNTPGCDSAAPTR